MRRRILFAAVVCLACWIATPNGQGGPASARAVDDEIIVKFRPDAPQARRDAALAVIGGGRIKHFEAIDQDHVRLPHGRGAVEAIASLLAGGAVVSAQPNYIRRIASAPPPNDFLWVNDTANGFYGVKKIQADLVWAAPHNNVGSSSVVIADIDTGVKYTHPDLAANMWSNPGEVPGNLIDDDANGYVDDIHGIDVFNHDSDPMDDHGHGTHTAGTFGAVGNNGPDYLTGTATVGVNWTVSILACKFLDAAGNGTDAGAIECLNYITALKNRVVNKVNIRVSNNSWGSERGGGPFPQALKDAFDAAGNAGILNVAAAGNGGANNIGDNIDNFPFDPASFTSPSIISVAASDSTDARASFSNFGIVSVDLAAPGVLIPSTWIGTDYSCFGSTCGYNKLNGTSMATPHVAGAAALLIAQSPNIPVAGLKSVILSNVTPASAWTTRVASGGRLNVFNAANVLAANAAPSVTITSPSPGAEFPAPGTFTFSANATDSNGTIAQVDFYANGMFITSDATSPYSIVMGGMPPGNYTLTAHAIDDLGGVGISAPVPITVTGGAPFATLSASSLTFGKQLVGSTSASQTISITNHGPSPLVFNSFNGAPPSSTFSVGVGNFQGQTDCPLNPSGLAPGGWCVFTFQSSPTVTGPHGASFSIVTNATSSPHSISLSGNGFIVDEATVAQAIASGGTRLQNLQNPVDGGWYFNAASSDCDQPFGASCPNIVGVTALGLLKAYERNPTQSMLDDAIDAGERLVQVYNTLPRRVPYSQDLEYLIALSEVTLDPQWQLIAEDWFLTVIAAHTDGADRVDFLLATRGTVAAWDSASLIRSAKAVGQADYALAVANRIRERQPDWLGVNQTHTYLGVGSLLWAWHDMPDFDFQIDAFRDFLLNSQDPVTGAWDNGNLQATAYAVVGLAAVGGAGTDAAIRAAVAFYIANQLPSNGWPSAGGGTSEFSNLDGEVIRAIATLYSTQAGASVQVAPAQLSRVTFDHVTTSGATTVVALDRSAAGSVPLGYSLVDGLTYDVQTTAEASGSITVCLAVPWAATAGAFDKLRIMHAENGVFVDRTIRVGPLSPDFGSKRVCALVSSLDAFAVGMADETTPPQLSVTLSPAVLAPANNQMVTVTATIAVSDNADPAPAITLVSITTNDGKHAKREDVEGAVMGTDDRTFSLRAERGERGAERVYTITYRATDRSGNVTEKSANVVVSRR